MSDRRYAYVRKLDGFRAIEERISDLEKVREAEHTRKSRILENIASFYHEQESNLGPIGRALSMTGIKSGQIREHFTSLVEVANKETIELEQLLQLNTEEIAAFERDYRAVLQLNPCLWITPSSPVWKCSFHAYYCGHSLLTSEANATATCTCDLPKNEVNPKVTAYGQGTSEYRYSYLYSYCWFEIPARAQAATVDISVLMNLHGFYILRDLGQYPPTLSLELQAKGYQYGYSWAEDSVKPLDLSGENQGRIDETKYLHFQMPVGADPFQVLVSAKLFASARGGGSSSVGDFGTGNGNLIRTSYVNTYG